MHDPMTVNQFRWFLTLVTGGVSAIWFLSDARKLFRSRLEASTPSVRDRRFGYSMGLIIASIGMIGSAKFMGWILTPGAVAAVTAPQVPTKLTDNLFVRGGDTADLAAVVATALGLGSDVKAASVRVDGEAFVHRGDDLTPLHITGVTAGRASELGAKYGAFGPDSAADPTIEIGTALADRLAVKVGDSIDLEIAKAHHPVRVTAIHDIKLGDLDYTGFMNLGTAQALLGSTVKSSVEIALAHDDPDHRVAKVLQDKLGAAHKVLDWCVFDHHLVCHWAI